MGALSIVTIEPRLLGLREMVLRQPAAEVPTQDPDYLKLCENLALEMFELMYAADGAAIAAPQVGISLRLVVMDPARLDFGPHVLINPVFQFKSGAVTTESEGCLSLPRRMGKIPRSTEVRVRAYNLRGELSEYYAEGWLARIFQHEIDHLDGILYPDRLEHGKSLFDNDTSARRRAIAAVKKVAGQDV
ncbi:MAG: peptide deformylase [Chloroflexi bacterium]|nr:peptide deformylase [Chloroflexota bacterium]